MRSRCLRNKLQQESGVVIITVLWVVIILSFLALSQGQNTRIEFALAKNLIGKIKSRYMAWAGVQYAMQHIYEDTSDEEAAKFDTLVWCGIRPQEDLQVEDLFKAHVLKGGSFEISYLRQGSEEDDAMRYYGLVDEERRINLNTLTKNNFKILSQLLMELGFEEDKALTVTHSVIDWRDPDNNPNDQEYGAELEYYEALNPPYRPKNMQYESVEELLLVRGVTPEIYTALKPYVTLYPLGGEQRINFDTASDVMLRALATAVSGASSGTDENDARSLVEKMLDYRRGDDQYENTNDDRVIELEDLVLNRRERALFIRMSNLHRARKSNYFRVRVAGIDGQRNVRTNIEAVVSRENLDILYWSRR